jgi:hypothetical protein
MNGLLADLLFQLETQTGPNVLDNTWCASLFQLLYSSGEMVVKLIHKKHRSSAYSIRFLLPQHIFLCDQHTT